MRSHLHTRGVVRLLTDLATPHRTVQIVPVVHQCARCGRYTHPVVQFEQGQSPVVAQLADNCLSCGESIDTPDTIASLIDAATLLKDGRITREVLS